MSWSLNIIKNQNKKNINYKKYNKNYKIKNMI